MKQTANFYKFLLLWTGELVSAIGSGLTSFGLGVYVFQQTGMASATALVTLLAFAPGLILGVPAGVLADRYDRRLLMILGDGLSALGLLFILFCLSLRGGRVVADLWGVTISSVFSLASRSRLQGHGDRLTDAGTVYEGQRSGWVSQDLRNT